ncbi:MAG: hypothetical protein DSY43_02680 [Gammaproteobacteria bacterium]|nr:MAG: hypothetical protein DSY43_02680 [Gammaproteobacteria bacterium]
MAVSDILIVMIYFFKHFVWLFMNNIFDYVLANALCKLYAFLINSVELVTLVTLLIISIERYRVTSLKIFSTQPYTLKKRIMVVSCSWLASMVSSFYAILVCEAVKSPIGHTYECKYLEASILFRVLFPLKSICRVLTYCSVLTLSVITSVRLSKPQAIQATF